MISSALHLALFRGHSIRWLWSPYLFVGDVFRKHNRLLAPIFRRKFTEHTFFFFSLKASEAYFLYIYFTPIKLCHLHSHSSSETTWVSPESSSMSSLKLNNFPLSLSLSTEVVQFHMPPLLKDASFFQLVSDCSMSCVYSGDYSEGGEKAQILHFLTMNLLVWSTNMRFSDGGKF